MTATFQFLVAQYLQDCGTKNILTLSKKFGISRNTMGATLRAMQYHNYIESDGSKPGNWSLLKMPHPRGFTPTQERKDEKKKSLERNTCFQNFIATLPLLRAL